MLEIDGRAVGPQPALDREPKPLRPAAFYTLHVWAWKESAAGPFVNWRPTVSCGNFDDQND